MTNQNNAEQAIKAAIRKAYDDGYNDAKMSPDDYSTYCVERAVRLDSADLLLKLRAPVADEWAAFKALSDLVNALRERHYGRMPEEVQQAYDRAWTLVFTAPTTALASAPVDDERNMLMRAIVQAGQKAGIIRADLETVSVSECLHILECLSKASAPVTNPIQWPTMPAWKGQSPVLFEDGYAEGWAKCMDECRRAVSQDSDRI